MSDNSSTTVSGMVSSFNIRVVPLHQMPDGGASVDGNQEDTASVKQPWGPRKV